MSCLGVKLKKTEIKSKGPCYGKIVYPSGVIYEGEFRKFNGIYRYIGQGTMTYEDGGRYVGQWHNGLRHGQGAMTYEDGMKHVGQWDFGVPHLKGTITYEDGRKFVGQWYMGKLHGNATMTWKNGKRLDGNFSNGIFGIGIYKLRNILDVWDGIRFWYYTIKY